MSSENSTLSVWLGAKREMARETKRVITMTTATSDTEMDQLLKFLCHGEEQALVNLKFFRGDRELVAPEELCHEVHSALEQRRLKLAVVTTNPPDADGEPVDVRELVDNL